jgi:hypothetical protein
VLLAIKNLAGKLVTSFWGARGIFADESGKGRMYPVQVTGLQFAADYCRLWFIPSRPREIQIWTLSLHAYAGYTRIRHRCWLCWAVVEKGIDEESAPIR